MIGNNSDSTNISGERDTFVGREWGENQTKIENRDNNPIITREMFVNYAKARIAAAIALQKENQAKSENPQASTENGRELEELQDRIEEYFPATDFDQINFLQTKLAMLQKTGQKGVNTNKQFDREFNKVYDKNIEKLKQLNAAFAHYVDPNTDAEKVIDQINKKASALRALETRPILQNHYTVNGIEVTSSLIPEGWLTPEQEKLYQEKFQRAPPQGPYSNPSTIRDGQQVGQANALRAPIKAGNTFFEGHRHGSPSVLKMKNEADRQHRTLQNVKQSMTLAAQHEFNKLNFDTLSEEQQNQIAKNGILTVDMASMSLLSPIMKGDKLDPMKQFRQVEDTRHAFWSLQGRVIPLTVVNGQGEKILVNVKLNSTFMSIGVNAARGVGTPGSKTLVQRINNRGINQLTENFLKNIDPTNPTLAAIAKNIKDTENDPNIVKYQAELNKHNQTSLPKLQAAYEMLEAYNKALSEGHSDGIESTKKIKSEREKILQTINKEESKADGIYKNLAQARQNAYSKSLPTWQSALDVLQAEPAKSKIPKNDKDFQKMRLFVDALDIYYNQPQPGLKRFLAVRSKANEKKKTLKKISKVEAALENPKNDAEKNTLEHELIALNTKATELQKDIDFLNKSNYRFQSRFLLLSENMDNFVEWMCKSGEDRTGLLNEHLEAFCIFIEQEGYPPRWDNEEDNKIFHEIMPNVHNGAPNRQANGLNDDSPGLKVTDKDFVMPSVSYEKDKKMANIQKNSSSIHGYSLKEHILHAMGRPSKSALQKQEQTKLKTLREHVNNFLHSPKQDLDFGSSPHPLTTLYNSTNSQAKHEVEEEKPQKNNSRRLSNP